MRIAMCQMAVEPGAPDCNLARAREMIGAAAEGGSEVAVLPECLDFGWADPAASDGARPVPGEFTAELCGAARRHGIHVVAGLTERAGPRLYNAAVLISPEGRILLHHRKINLLEGVEDAIYSTGDRLGVAQAAGATVGIDICADNFPETLAMAKRWPGWGRRSSSPPAPGPWRRTTTTSASRTARSGAAPTARWRAVSAYRWWG